MSRLIASMHLTSKAGECLTGEVERLNPEDSARQVTAPTLCHTNSIMGLVPQQTPDSALAPGRVQSHSAHAELTNELTTAQPTDQYAFPTDAKEREKAHRKADKEQGIEKVVKKRKKIMEDHHDDCGDDLSSLHDTTEAMFSVEPTIFHVSLTPMMLCLMKTMTIVSRYF